MTLGLRYDDSGNPWSKSASTVFGNFYLGTGATEQEQVANGYAKATHNALLHSVDNLFSPRIGFAWDPTGNADWVVRGGFGIYNNWLTQANVQEEFRGSPPGEVAATFYAGGTVSAQGSHFCSRKQQQSLRMDLRSRLSGRGQARTRNLAEGLMRKEELSEQASPSAVLIRS